MSSIVVGYDDSPCAQAALKRAIDLASNLGDELVIAYGVRPPGRPGEEFKAHAAALKELGDAWAKKAVAQAAKKGVQARTRVMKTRVAEGLADLAAKEQARMIVVGTHGERPIRGALLGSTPHRLLHLSEVPVLVVPG